MSRLTMVLVAVVAAMIPQAAASVTALPERFERPAENRHAINAVLGDISFHAKYGTLPPPGTDPHLRVRTHLEFVHALLSRRDVSGFPPELLEARRANLGNLRDYIDAGCFPRNYDYADQNRPCFIDKDDNICAVGYLVEQTAGQDAAERINTAFQSEFLWRMKAPEVDRWIASSGLSLLELSMIQPTYDPEFRITVSQDWDTAPATISVAGSVIDVGFGCGIKQVVFDVGDGAIWMSPIYDTGAYWVPVDFEYTYFRPDIYTLTGSAVSVDWCGNIVVSETWEIVLAVPTINIAAVVSDGPPYSVYVETASEIRMDHIQSATVDWGDGGPATPAGWFEENGKYRTLAHEYALQGTKHIVVTNGYGTGPDAYNVTCAVEVTLGTVATELSSWGRIKALFASR